MPKIRVEYKRDECIGAAACAAVNPEKWEIKEDGLADLIGSKLRKDGFYELEISDADLENMMLAAESCPVNVIHIYDKNGNKLI